MGTGLVRMLVTASVVGLLVVGVGRPVPAAATNTGEAVLIGTAAFAGYVAIVVVGTAIVYHHGFDFADSGRVERLGESTPTEGGLRFGSRCPRRPPGFPLACW